MQEQIDHRPCDKNRQAREHGTLQHLEFSETRGLPRRILGSQASGRIRNAAIKIQSEVLLWETVFVA